MAQYAEGFILDDRRAVAQVTFDPAQTVANNRLIFDGGGTFEHETLAIRGRSLALERWVLRIPDPEAIEVVLTVVLTDANGRHLRATVFDPDDLERAYELLEARHAELQAEEAGNSAWRAALRVRDALNRRDWDGFVDALHPEFEYVDLRNRLTQVGDDSLDTFRFVLTFDEFSFARTLVATWGDRLALMADAVTFRDGDAGPAEVTALNLYEVDERGLVIRSTAFIPENMDEARAAMEARAAELEPD